MVENFVHNILKTGSFKHRSELAGRLKTVNPVWGLIWHFLGLPFILIVSAFVAWGEIVFQLRSIPMVIMVVVVYIGIWANRYQADNYRSYRAFGLSAFYTTVAFLLIFALLAIVRTYYSRSFMMSSYLLTLLWLGCGMLFFRSSQHRSYLVVRGGLADKLKHIKRYNWDFTDHPGRAHDLKKYDGVVVDLHAQNNPGLLKTLANTSLQGIPVMHAAAVLEQHTGRTNLDYLAHEGLYKLAEKNSYSYFKRLWEISFIVLMSPVFLPVMLLTAVAVKAGSKERILYAQERVGKDGEIFTLYKFRSMKEDTEEGEAKFAGEKDARITKTGRFIRRFRIDELPQFWNVIRGDMSLIGPRPEQPEFVRSFEKNIPFYSYRHKVRPGITGWAQVKDGYADNLESSQVKLEHDLYYVKNMSLSLDLLIVYATLKTIVTGFGSR